MSARRAQPGRVVLAVVLAAAAAACSAPAKLQDLSAAEAAERDGRTDDALASYRAAQLSCRKVTPARLRREECARAFVGEAELLEQTGKTREAIAAYAAIPLNTDNDPPPSALGLYRAGQLSLEAGDEVAAYRWLWQTITDFPDEAFAADAVSIVVRDGRRRDVRALWRELSKLVAGLDQSQVADNLLWALADLSEHDLDDKVAARTLLDRIPVDYPESGLRDDARWHAARLSSELGDAAGAVTRLRALTATREVAFGVGSYFSVWLDDAQLRLGIVLRDDVKDLRGAAAAFRQLPRDYPASILIDDATFELAVTLGQAGDRPGACAELARLVEKWPDSRYQLERAPALAGELGCPPAPAPAARAAATSSAASAAHR